MASEEWAVCGKKKGKGREGKVLGQQQLPNKRTKDRSFLPDHNDVIYYIKKAENKPERNAEVVRISRV